MTYFKHRHSFNNKLLALTVCNIMQRMTGDICTLYLLDGVGWIVVRETGTGTVKV